MTQQPQSQQDPILTALGYLQLMQSIIAIRKFVRENQECILDHEKKQLAGIIAYLMGEMPSYEEQK